MGIRLIATDLDGTLLGEDHLHVSGRNREALRQASERGIRVVIASGRTRKGLDNILEQVPFVDYALTSNGAAVTDLRTGGQLVCAGMPYELWRPVYDILRKGNAVFEVYADGRSYMERRLFARYENEALSEEFVSRLKAAITPMDDGRELLAGKSIEKICALASDPEAFPQMFEELQAMPHLAITSSIPGNLEINAENVNKGCGLAALCDKIGIKAEEVMAFGDAGNDLEMLAFAGRSYAMSNAHPQVREAAGFLTGSNTEDGVAQAVEQMLEEKMELSY